jgi:ATP-dependent Lon protease
MTLEICLMSNLQDSTRSFETKARSIFGEACIDKGLFIKSGILQRSIPTFVGEWLVDRFCRNSSLTPEAQEQINRFIDEHLPRKDQKEAIKHRLAQGETITILDQFSAFVDLKDNRRRVRIPCIDETGFVDGTLLDRYANLLGGGLWGAGRLVYHPPDPTDRSTQGEIWLSDFKPMQVARLDLDYYCQERSNFTLQEWRELLVNSMGSNPEVYTPEQQMLLLARLVPIVQPRVNLIELAPKGTGKSFVYQNMSRYVRVVSGGKVTAAVLFYNLASQTAGLLTQYDVVVFDEAQTISFDNPGEIIGVLKDYLESGRYTRGRQMATADAGLVLLGNIPLDAASEPAQPILFYNMPGFLQETAFVDRLHGIIPGWRMPRITVKTPARGLGFKADFFSEVLHALRYRGGYEDYVSAHMRITGSEDMRDRKAIERLAAGYLRLLFPDMHPMRDEFMHYCVEPAIRLRQTVRDQLSKMDPEFKNAIIHGEAV